MKFSHDIRYAASSDDVYAMLAEQAFRDQVCQAVGALEHTVQVTTAGDGMSVVIDQRLPAGGIPSFAKKFVGDTIQVVQKETWTNPTHADLDVSIPGKPGHLRGDIALVEQDGKTVEKVTGDLKVSIPMVGGKLEDLIAKLLANALRAEQRTGERWLTAAGG